MNSSYLCPRGSVINTLSRNQAGIYTLEGLENKKGDYPLLITSVAYNKQDIVSTVSCLNNVKVIYSFGEEFGGVAVAGQILLGPVSTGASTNQLQGLLSWFASNRVSKSKRPVQASILQTGAIRFYLHSLRIGEPNVQFHVQPFLLSGVLVE